MSKKAHGFITDAKKLVGAFVAKNNSDFTVFADVWKKQNFSMVFLGRPNEKELLEFSRRILQITMELFYDSKADETKVGYLFLLYGLVRYQPINPPIKARVTLEHWEHIEKLRDDAEAKKNTSVLFVIRYLIRSGFDFVATPTLMGPCLSSDATAVNLREEETEGKLNKASETCCVIQEDLETCFQELKVQKKEYEECLNAVCPRLTDNNAPFSAFLDVLEPPGNNRQADGIGRRRALLKAAAYSKVIEKAKNHTSSISKGKKKAAKNKGPARKLPVGEGPNKIEQEVNLVSETSLSKFDFKGKRGQKREKLFKEKYHFLEGTNVKKGETK